MKQRNAQKKRINTMKNCGVLRKPSYCNNNVYKLLMENVTNKSCYEEGENDPHSIVTIHYGMNKRNKNDKEEKCRKLKKSN